ncbi:MAG: sigma-70 family RNA polymerase sigma factor, partial [Muribaculaceae bacterium]|nr:sigma-70 family RNA polymerase sigma factor [Muribaculaceae bacterium]
YESTEREKEATYNIVLRLSRQALNETQYTVFRLHDIEGLTYPEIAQSLGMTQENVRMTLSRARKAIRELYRKTNHD